ncbi:MAG: PfkB family carbohydrate kinase [Candidatus Promineifilaceae bacterium]
MESRSRPDYLIIGHVTHDLTPAGITTGGTVAYSGLAAQALGCRTCVVTSAGPDFDPTTELPGLDVHIVNAAETTTFENIYTADGRQQFIHRRASEIEAVDIPPTWLQAPIIHLAPLADEFSPEIIHTFSTGRVGITPQGWLREWDESGQIKYKSWPPDAAVLSKAAVLVVSEEDIPPNELLRPYRDHVPILVQTRGRKGCAVYQGESCYKFPAPDVQEVNPTGAGDIFATAFLIRLQQTNNLREAAVFANKIAAWSVTGKTLPEKISVIEKHLER